MKVKSLQWIVRGKSVGPVVYAGAFGVTHFYSISGKEGDWTLSYPGADCMIHVDGFETQHSAREAAQVDYVARASDAIDTNASSASPSHYRMPTPPGNQIRTAECDGEDAVPVTGQLPVGTASPGFEQFAEYFLKNYPGPDTVIFDPKWHAPKIYRAAVTAYLAAIPAPSSHTSASLSRNCCPPPPDRQPSKQEPDTDNCNQTSLACRTSVPCLCEQSELPHQLRRNQTNSQGYAKRHDQQVIQITQNRDKVRDQIDRRQRISGNTASDDLCGQRRTLVSRGNPKRDDIPLEGLCPGFGLTQQWGHQSYLCLISLLRLIHLIKMRVIGCTKSSPAPQTRESGQ